MVAVNLDYPAALSAEEVEDLPPGQAHWWLRKGSDFVRLPRRVRGDEPLKCVVHLEPGEYQIGVGPSRGGVRESLVVEEAVAEKPKKRSSAKPTIDLSGKSVVITGDLQAYDRDGAKAWLTSLGAKVTSSVSGKTDYLLVGANPGAKKIETAQGLGTKQITEGELRAALGLEPVSSAAPITASPKTSTRGGTGAEKVARIVSLLKLEGKKDPKLDAIVGPKHFADLGLTEKELWGIAIGPRGGQYSVHVDLDDRPSWGIRCNCSTRNPCKHGLALVLTASRHFVPPAPSPAGHRESARFTPSWE